MKKIPLKFKVLILFLVAILPRVVCLNGHSLFADEITWMVRGKGVYAAVHSRVFSYFNNGWWLDTTTSEPIGLPMAFLGGAAMAYLSSGYSHYTLNMAQDFVAARIPAVIIGSLFIPIFYLLLRKFIDDKIAFIASLFMALDPISIGLSRWLHQDLALMAFSTLSILIFLYSKNKFATAASAFLTAMAILTKPQGFLVPITLIIFMGAQFLTKRKTDVKRLIVWLILAGIFTISFFPFLWKDPIGGMLKYLVIQNTNALNGQLTFFNGNITTSPPWYYYFAIFPFRIPESILLGFLVGIVLALLSLKRGFTKNSFVQVALIYSILFLIVISVPSKKLGIRYLFGVWPYIYVLATFGLFKLSERLRGLNRMIFWTIVFVFPVWGIIKFYPSYYLFYNHFVTPKQEQNLEDVAFCDSVKPAMEYLGSNTYQGMKIMLPGCASTINYYTGYTVKNVLSVNAKPDYIIEENYDALTNPKMVVQIQQAGYKEIKELDFRGLVLARIYQKPPNFQ
jgi:hypothetical protein